MRFDFAVNMKTARELGITFPREILLQFTEVKSSSAVNLPPRSGLPDANTSI